MEPTNPDHEPRPADEAIGGQTTGLPGLPEVPVYHLSPPPVEDVYYPLPRPRRRWLPAGLFLLTCFTTFGAGVLGWQADFISPTLILARLADRWSEGLTYMVAVMGILLAHEMGHFLMTLRHHVPASFPFFIPFPVAISGTMGAVIGMNGSRADRKQLFDIGLAGPIAGLVVAVPLLVCGIMYATAPAAPPGPDDIHFGVPLLVKLLLPVLRPDLPPDVQLNGHPLYMAAWVGMLITGLNMLPVSQLDGGHVIYGLLGRYSVYVARAFLLAAFTYIIIDDENTSWLVMAILITIMGVDHPPSANDQVRIGPLRYALGIASLAIPVLCFIPVPLK